MLSFLLVFATSATLENSTSSKVLHCNTDLLVLICCDCGENSFREAESLHSFPGWHWLGGRELTAEVFPDHMNTRLILVHGV